MTAARRLADAEQASEHFLGVRASAKGLAWRDRLDHEGQNRAAAIAERHGLPDLLGRVLAARGATVDSTPLLLEPTLKALLPDPSSLAGMDQAAARLAAAIRQKELIAIFGDYDVDGACSSALLHRFLAAHGVGSRIYIPDRLHEGYGPNAQAIEMLIAEGARLIVTADCGTTSHEVLGLARSRGADVLVIDHHQADERLPDVHAVVNPNRQDDLSGLGHLCAAGVVFMTLVATARELRRTGFYATREAEPALLDWLDLVALATVCDVVPLTGLNRAFVAKGLAVLASRRNVGLRALSDAAGLSEQPSPYTLGFVLGPRINAGGRIGDSALGARLLTLEDEAEAGRIAATLDRLNRERRAIETEILEEALAAADAELAADPLQPMVIQGSRDWHKGVVGLVASRLTDRLGRPSLVIAWNGSGEGTGSLRSIAGVDIGAAVRAAVAAGLLLKGGGHAMAAGLTVAEEKLGALKAFLAQRVGTPVAAARGAANLAIDAALTARSVNAELLALIGKAGPFGQGNPTPRFGLPSHRVRSVRIMGEAHIRATLEGGDGARIEGVAFRSVGSPLGDALTAASGGLPMHVAGHLRRDTWGGREKIELMIEDIADPRRQER